MHASLNRNDMHTFTHGFPSMHGNMEYEKGEKKNTIVDLLLPPPFTTMKGQSTAASSKIYC